ncbi:MAG TPA: C45 family autoproteolytic acyltransferase/hydrolase [Kofleriaceae bacterium]|nr:C45 family autoproteolytic acyltransferase/hydrolase [Kofleriaceae bacterium]
MPELMIGGRRSAAPRSWRAAVIAAAMLGVAAIVTWFIYRRSVAYDMPGGEVQGAISLTQAGPGAPPALVFGTSSLAWTGAIPVLRVVGDAHTIGAAHGRLLAPWLAQAVRATAPSIEGTVGPGGWFAGSTRGMRLAWQWRFTDEGLLDADRRMVAGLTRGAEASGVPLSFEELVRGQAVLDVGEPSPRTAEADDHSLARSLTIVARTTAAPARLWIGRAFALPGLDDGGDAAIPIVTIAHPEGRSSWASVGWPGALGVVTGVNAHGIAVMVNPVRTADVRVTRTARPIAHLARNVLEQAKTLDEAVKLIEATPTLGAAVFALADGAGAWLVVERTPTKAIVERSPRAAALGDVLTTNALAGDPENDRARRMLTTTARMERAGKLVRAPLADIGTLAAVLRDQRTPDDAVRPAGHRGVINDGRAAHVAILDPAALALWVADPRAGGRMRGFDLRYELRREGEQPAPPADIAADPTLDPDRAAALATARADLRAARAALRAGDHERADEACARARARAPALPEALELDAFIAQARGDRARARAAFQAWLDGGADDPKGEERARALLAR